MWKLAFTAAMTGMAAFAAGYLAALHDDDEHGDEVVIRDTGPGFQRRPPEPILRLVR